MKVQDIVVEASGEALATDTASSAPKSVDEASSLKPCAERDEASGEAVMRLEAVDKGIGGNVRADLRMTLTENGTGSELRMVTEATLAGRIGDLGQPIVKRKADQVVSEFARCLERTLGAEA